MKPRILGTQAENKTTNFFNNPQERSGLMLPHSCGLIGFHLGQSLFCC